LWGHGSIISTLAILSMAIVAPGCAGLDGIPMSLTLPERWNSALIVGRTPWSARDALVPLFPRRIRHLRSLRSRPGGRLRTRASAPPSDADGRTWQSKWHWDAILRGPRGAPALGAPMQRFITLGQASTQGKEAEKVRSEASHIGNRNPGRA
jgi:hypothetical protein